MRTFDEYTEFTKSLAAYNTDVFYKIGEDYHPAPWTYPVHALAEEAGEVNGKIAKYIRKYGVDINGLREMVAAELGDVAYQLSETARMFGLSFQDVIDLNVSKLTDRSARGVIVGEGDTR